MFLLTNIDRETIKISNSKKILQLLYREGNLTKQDISKQLGISIPTVTHNVNSLLEEGYVKEAGMADSTGGRKPIVIEFIPNAKYSVGVDIKPRHLHIVLTNLKSEIIDERSLPLIMNETDEVMNRINVELEELLKEHSIKRTDLLGIGFSLHGTVKEDELIFELAPNAPFKNIDFHKYESLFKTNVYIENEANAAAIGESLLGIAKQMKNLVYISINEGVGTGIVIRGYLYKGKNDRAGEFGHMIIDDNGPKCNCGNTGCWEMYVSTRGLKRIYFEKTDRDMEIEDIFIQYKEGNKEAIQVIKAYINYLALGIKNILFTLDPHYIVIGGEMSKYGKYYFKELVERVYNSNLFFNKGENKIMLSSLDGKASALGASLLPLSELFYVTKKII